MDNHGAFVLSLGSQLLNIYLHTIGYDWSFLEGLLKIAFEQQTADIVENDCKAEGMSCSS